MQKELLEIPPPPPVPTPVETISEVVSSSSLAEPAFTEIGLGGWSPSGLIQSALEVLHIGLEIPWWGCIALGMINNFLYFAYGLIFVLRFIGVLTVRTVMFPLVIKAQQNAARMTNNMPQLQVLQQKMTDARLSGNAMQC